MPAASNFWGVERIDAVEMWWEYSDLKQTYAQLAEKYGCSPHNIKRKLDEYIPSRGATSSSKVVVVIDTSYWERKCGVMLFRDALTGSDLLWYFVKNETNALYAQVMEELESMGYETSAVVLKTEVCMELKEIVDMLTRTDKESFVGMFDEWRVKWDDYLKGRTTDPETGKGHYTHRRLRSAYLSVKRNLPLLFTRKVYVLAVNPHAKVHLPLQNVR